MSWRLLISPPLDGPANMALDHALLDRARATGETHLRVYGWSKPVLSLGRNQRAAGLYDEAALSANGVGVVRRPTGGRALLHHRELTYSLTAPVNDSEPLGAAYDAINALLLEALAALGVNAELARPEQRATSPGMLPCFAEPAAREIVVGGRKLVGSAQWRDDGALLQHGSILVDDDQLLIPRLMRDASAVAAAPSPATLRGVMGRAPEAGELARALFAAVRADRDANALPLDDAELGALDVERHRAHYSDPAWTWHR